MSNGWNGITIDKNVIIPFLGHKLYIKHYDWDNDIVILACKDKCCKSQRIRLTCSIRDYKNLEANVWTEIIKGEGRIEYE